MAEPDPSTPDAAQSEAEQTEAEHLEDEFFDEDEYPEGDGDTVETIDEHGPRHIRRAAPEGTDEIRENEAPRRTGLPDAAERWRARSAVGGVMTAFALGLQQAFEPERNQPAIIMETSGDPPTDLPVEAQLAQLGPRQSSVTVRPWLIGRRPVPGAPVAPGAEGSPAPDTGGPATASPATASPAPGRPEAASSPGEREQA